MDTIGRRLIDPTHGGKTDIFVTTHESGFKSLDATVYNCNDLTVSLYYDGGVVIGDIDGDATLFKGSEVYNLYLILGDILQRKGYAVGPNSV